MQETLTVETFAPLVGNTFSVTTGEGGPVELTLSSVNRLSSATAHRRRVPFSLLFHSDDRRILPQAIYRLDNGQIPDLELFIVPLGPDGRGLRYEAIFT